MYRKATELHILEEERFLTEQRRRAAEGRFRQEQALETAVEDRRRLLTTARVRFFNCCIKTSPTRCMGRRKMRSYSQGSTSWRSRI